MRFHGVFLGNQHEIWSKQHNGKVNFSPFSLNAPLPDGILLLSALSQEALYDPDTAGLPLRDGHTFRIDRSQGPGIPYDTGS